MKKSLCLFTITLLLLLSAGCSYQPTFLPEELSSDIIVTDNRDSIEIAPAAGSDSATGLLFYPGGLVDSHVYDELLAQFSVTTGIKCVVAKMPANLAVFNINAGLTVTEDFPEIDTWVIAGHSLGGSMAASTVKRNPSFYAGLVFMDSYPAASDSLKNWEGTVLSLFSSVEKISDSERMENTLDLIPPATWLSEESRVYPSAEINYSVLHMIEGGSHSYFGTYGPQDGDFTPTVTREVFHAEVVDYMAEFFEENGWGAAAE